MSFSATRAAFEGFRLIRAKPGVLVGWALFYVVALALVIGGGVLIFGTSALPELIGRDRHYASLAEALPLLQPFAALIAFLFVTLMIVGSVQVAAVYRAVLRPDDRGLAYIRFGGDELRQMALMFLILLIHGAIWSGIAAGLIALHALRYVQGPGAAAVYVAGAFSAAFLSIFLGVRLSLAAPMTFARRRLHLGRAWSLTRGEFWPLLGMFLLTLVFILILSMGTDAIGHVIVAAAGLGALSWSQAETYDLAAWSSALLGGAAVVVLLHVVSQAVQLAVFYAPQAAAYRDLSNSRDTTPPVVRPDHLPPGGEAASSDITSPHRDAAPQEPVATTEPASASAVHAAASEHDGGPGAVGSIALGDAGAGETSSDTTANPHPPKP